MRSTIHLPNKDQRPGSLTGFCHGFWGQGRVRVKGTVGRMAGSSACHQKACHFADCHAVLSSHIQQLHLKTWMEMLAIERKLWSLTKRCSWTIPNFPYSNLDSRFDISLPPSKTPPLPQCPHLKLLGVRRSLSTHEPLLSNMLDIVLYSVLNLSRFSYVYSYLKTFVKEDFISYTCFQGKKQKQGQEWWSDQVHQVN